MASTPAAPVVLDRSKKSNLFSNLGFINFSGARNQLKLRQNWKVSDRLRVEYGLDVNSNLTVHQPWAGVLLKLDDKEDSWAVDINTDWAHVITPTVDLIPFTNKFSLPVSATLGKNFFTDDAPHFEVGIHNTAVALALLAVSLAAGQKLNLQRKELALFSVGFPVKYRNGLSVPSSLQENVEVDACLGRRGWGLGLDITGLNAVLRLKQN